MKPCTTCPFNDGITDEASQAQNYGCLPTRFDMMKHFDQKGVSISCHNSAHKRCIGYYKSAQKQHTNQCGTIQTGIGQGLT